MTDAELLHHYIARERIIFGGERSPGHCRLREFGFIEEHPTSLRNLLITVTNAGRVALEPRPVA
jgi:hypothetical protein